MKRALFSSEAGAGSSPIAHSAAKTDEPVREGVVGGLEPFIDTIVVCTFTALVILSSGVWNRSPDAFYEVAPTVVPVENLGTWSMETTLVPRGRAEGWVDGDPVFMVIAAERNKDSGNNLHRINGVVVHQEATGDFVIEWDNISTMEQPRMTDLGVFVNYNGATLTARSFDSALPGLGKWLVTMAAWLFAISTMISWSYYGEQGMVFMLGNKSVVPYKFVFCFLVFVSTLGFIRTPEDLDNFSSIGAGVMLWANLPIMLFFGHKAMAAYKEYIGKLKRGEMEKTAAPSWSDVITGRDVG